ncbi:MAG TPA: triose-phosphate isomerase [Sphingomicrobium sp.]|jgi:triosephosphate isomerase|nr:triose-phosphate isomerase [Sphingomicrobium sp.]
MARKKLVVGNWKMHGISGDLDEIRVIAAASSDYPQVDVGLCLPATLIERAVRAVPDFPVGGQDVHFEDKGAHTGCVCTAMLIDAGATMVIVGHSERRDAQHESDSEVRRKAEAALNAGLLTIVCVGESLSVREAGDAIATVECQLDASLPHDSDVSKLAIAYEPIWAIGTGRTATVADIAEMHAALRERLRTAYGDAGEKIRILYGGSVKPDNAGEIFSVMDVDGALVGGASLTAADFVPIVEAAA